MKSRVLCQSCRDGCHGHACHGHVGEFRGDSHAHGKRGHGARTHRFKIARAFGRVQRLWWMVLMLLISSGGTAAAKEPSQTTDDSKRLGATIVQACLFRTAAAADFSKAIVQYRAEKPLRFLSPKGLTKQRALAMSAFMTGALVLTGHADSAEPIVAFYNPLYDAVLITRWSAAGDWPEIVAADMRVASRMAAGGNGPLPRYASWLDAMAKKPAPEVIKDEYTAFLKAFERAYPPRATTAAALPVSDDAEKVAAFVEGQALDAVGGVAAIQRVGNPRYNARLKELRDALARRDKEALSKLVPSDSATSAGVLAERPADVLQTLVPCYVLLSEKDSLVFLQDTALPRCYMLVVFRHDPTPRDAVVRSVFFFELPRDVR